MSAPRAVWEVARREVVERSRSRAFRISVVLLMILSIGGAVAAARLSGGTPTDDIGLVGARARALGPAIRAEARAEGRRARLHQPGSAPAARRLLRAGTLDIAVLDGERLIVRSSRSQPAVHVVQTAAVVTGVLARLRSSGLSPAEARAVLTPPPLPVLALERNDRAAGRERGLVYIGLLVLYVALLFYGQTVAQGVTEEKASRVVELLLTTVAPRRLLAGKVLGIGALGALQLALAGAAALIAGQAAGAAGLPSAAPKAFALVVLWFVLGYAFYSVVCAAVGALVSRQEDLAAAMAPVSILIIGAFLLASFTLGSPNGTLAEIAAFVPPFAPMIVPTRVVLGDMNAVGLIVAVIVDLLATAGLMVVAARVYERSILRIGAPIALRHALARSQ